MFINLIVHVLLLGHGTDCTYMLTFVTFDMVKIQYILTLYHFFSQQISLYATFHFLPENFKQ